MNELPRAMNKCLVYLFLCVCLPLTQGCDIDDSRDECCTSLTMEYRYTKGAQDLFAKKINCIRHFLFDEDGTLLQVFEPSAGSDMQRQQLKLPQGTYAMLSIANAALTEQVRAEPYVSSLSGMMLELDQLEDSAPKGNCSRLYYGFRTFEAEDNKKLCYISDMSNIHCVFDVTVRWKSGKPNHLSPYTIVMSNISGRYSNVSPVNRIKVFGSDDAAPDSLESTADRIVHSFPLCCQQVKVSHRQEVSMYNHQLRATFVSLRYRDNQIPTIGITNNGVEVMRTIDLTDTFRNQGWRLDDNIEQRFAIVIEIDGDRDIITVSPAEMHHSDWEDGGVVG